MKRIAYFLNFESGEAYGRTFADCIALYGQRVEMAEGRSQLRYFLNDAGDICARYPDGSSEPYFTKFPDPATVLLRWACCDAEVEGHPVYFTPYLDVAIQAVLDDLWVSNYPGGKKLTPAKKKKLIEGVLTTYRVNKVRAPFGLLPAIAE